jgi:hypothetical protein
MKQELRELRREKEGKSKNKYEGWQSETTDGPTFEEDNPLWCKSEKLPTDQATV